MFSSSSCPQFRESTCRSRREFLRAGSLSLFGLGLPTLLQAQRLSQGGPTSGSATVARSFGKAKACIVLFMWGGPAQQETWDLKPEAPEQVRGEFRPIATNVPGILISEHFPMLAQQVPTGWRSCGRCTTGTSTTRRPRTNSSRAGRCLPAVVRVSADWPHYGAVLGHLNHGHERTSLPPFVQMRPTIPNGAPRFVEESHGQGAGWLGPALNPMTIDDDPSRPDYRISALDLPGAGDEARLGDRARFSVRWTIRHEALERMGQVGAMESHYARAYSMLTARRSLEAFDLSREDPRMRARYGLHTHGQAVLQARRLVEAGVPLVTVFWQNDGLTNVSVYWDTHNRNFVDLKTRLMPPADQAFAALLDDLEVRGLLDETLIVWTGEFGRTPRVGQSVVGGAGAGRDGRDHWPHCFSTVLAGAGVRGGTVYGQSDRWAAYPARDPVTPADIAATVYHLLGVDPALELRDNLRRPMRICLGTPITDVIA